MMDFKSIKTVVIVLLLILKASIINAQTINKYENKIFLKHLYSDTSYVNLKNKIDAKYANAQPVKWGEFVKGVDEDIVTKNKLVALTFDACGGRGGNEYDKELIDFLSKENIPATLFFTGKWIDENFETFIEISKNKLFEIENHGFNHQPCSIDGESEYHIKGTQNVAAAYDEIEANARKIEAIIGKKPKFYRSSTAFTDEACAKMAHSLGIQIISFDVLSGDAIPKTPTKVIVNNVISTVKPGAIIIMHMNHPKWNGYEALKKIIPELKKQGYQFVTLNQYPLKSKN